MLRGGGAEVVDQDDLLEADVACHPRVVAFEADDVRRAVLARKPAEDAAEGAGTEVAVPGEQADAVVRMKFGGGRAFHVPYLTPQLPGGYASTASIEGFAPAASVLQAVELPASAVGTDEEELGLAALIRIGDTVRLPPARADATDPRALRAAEDANVSGGSAVGVHAYIIAQHGLAVY
jgi:hypothetical protein